MEFTNDQSPWLFYGLGALLAVVGVAMFFIDQDPALLFESPVFTLFMILIGGGIGYLGWQNQHDTSAAGPTEQY